MIRRQALPVVAITCYERSKFIWKKCLLWKSKFMRKCTTLTAVLHFLNNLLSFIICKIIKKILLFDPFNLFFIKYFNKNSLNKTLFLCLDATVYGHLKPLVHSSSPVSQSLLILNPTISAGSWSIVSNCCRLSYHSPPVSCPKTCQQRARKRRAPFPATVDPSAHCRRKSPRTKRWRTFGLWWRLSREVARSLIPSWKWKVAR